MNDFKKIDLALGMMAKAEEKTEIETPLSLAELEQVNRILAASYLPPLTQDLMYLFSKGRSYRGPYISIYGLEHIPASPPYDDVMMISTSHDVNEKLYEDDVETKYLVFGYMKHDYGLPTLMAYRDGRYYEIEDERGSAYNGFPITDNLGDFLIQGIQAIDKRKLQKEVEDAERKMQRQSEKTEK